MKKKILIAAAAILLASLYMFLSIGGGDSLRPVTTPEPTMDVTEYSAPSPSPQPTPELTPSPSPEPTPEPTPEPKSTWTLAFAGDCTIGTVHEWQGSAGDHNMLWVMGDDYAYPFANVADAFSQADFSMVNLEGTFTDETATRSKQFRFRSPPRYAETLVLANIDAASLANNHSGDYRQQGLEDTRAALDEKGILWADDSRPLIVELEGDLRIGIVAHNNVEIDLDVGDVDSYMERITPLYEQCVQAECDIIIGFVHWGWEYTDGPETWMVDLAHRMVDMGIDMLIGSHAHVLQETEIYNGVPIFYSMGNFCFGGHSDPDDKDSVIVFQTLRRESDGSVVLDETRFLPCSISSTEDKNDFRPRLLSEDEPAYGRVLEKLRVDDYRLAREQ